MGFVPVIDRSFQVRGTEELLAADETQMNADKSKSKEGLFFGVHPRSWAANCSLAYSLTYPNLAGWGLVIGDDLAPFGGLVSDD